MNFRLLRYRIVSLFLYTLHAIRGMCSKRTRRGHNIDVSRPYNVQTYLQDLTVDEVRAHAVKSALPYEIMLYNLDFGNNIGASIRSAVGFGVRKVWLVGKKHYNRTSAVGAYHYTNVEVIPEIEDNFFEKRGLFPIFIEQGGSNLESLSLTGGEQIPCFIFGRETDGIPIHEMERFPTAPVISLPMAGVIRSLNVSATVAIICYHAQTRLQKMIT